MTREEAIQWLTDIKENITENWSHDVAIDMEIEALSKPNYESESEVRLAVVNRYKDRVILFDPFGEEEYLPPSADADTYTRITGLMPDAVSREEYEEVKAYMDTLVDAFIEDGEELAESVKVVRCKDCLYKQLMDEGDTKYYYCALEDRPNRNWSVDDTDYCAWAERREP